MTIKYDTFGRRKIENICGANRFATGAIKKRNEEVDKGYNNNWTCAICNVLWSR